MSGAMGNEHDPTTGEPIEPAETAVDEAEQPGTEPAEGGDEAVIAAEPDVAEPETAQPDASGAAPAGLSADTAVYDYDDAAPSGESEADATAEADEAADDEHVLPGGTPDDDPDADAYVDAAAAAAATDAVREHEPADEPTHDDTVVDAPTDDAAAGDAPTEVIAAGDAPVVAAQVEAASADDAPTDAVRADDAETPAARDDAATALLPAADEVPEPEEGGEPDYAALAAELEEFETRQRGSAGAAAAGAGAAAGSGWFEPAPETFRATEPGEQAPADDAPTEAFEPATPTVATAAATTVLPSEPASADEETPAEKKQSAAIFETYEPPRKRGNRVAALLIGVPATIVFTILYALVDLAWAWFQNEVALDTLVTDLLARITEPAYWVPVVTFFVAFWLVGVLVNRGRAGWWFVLGFLVAAATYAAVLFAPILTYPFWLMTPNDAQLTLDERWLSPVALGAFIIAREVTVWFGAWAAGRGRRMKRLNAEDKAEYDKAVASGE